MKTTKLDKILQYFKVKDKLKIIYDKAEYPKAKSKNKFVNMIINYILGAFMYYQFSASTIIKNKKCSEWDNKNSKARFHLHILSFYQFWKFGKNR